MSKEKSRSKLISNNTLKKLDVWYVIVHLFRWISLINFSYTSLIIFDIMIVNLIHEWIETTSNDSWKKGQFLPCHLTLHNNVVKLRFTLRKVIDKNFKHEYSC